MATRTFREKKNNKAESLFGLNFNVYINVEKRERAEARNKKQRRPILLRIKLTNFVGRKTWKFYSRGDEKMRNASGHQDENERQWKKSEQRRIQDFLHKTCN